MTPNPPDETFRGGIRGYSGDRTLQALARQEPRIAGTADCHCPVGRGCGPSLASGPLGIRQELEIPNCR
eukprot:14474225-Alexandrium_andersonii.AAC.1